jgi:hypothetical protein
MATDVPKKRAAALVHRQGVQLAGPARIACRFNWKTSRKSVFSPNQLLFQPFFNESNLILAAETGQHDRF